MGVKIREKPKRSGVWWVFINHRNRRKSKKVGKKATALEVAKLIEAELTLGRFEFEDEKPKPEPTFKEYADSWIKTTVPATCKHSTVTDYNALLANHVLPEFGKLKLSNISRGLVKDFLLNKINDGKAHSTVKHMKSVISGVLEKALDDEVISANPARNLGKIIKINNKADGINPLSIIELNILLDSVQKRYKEYYPLFLLLARTGLRIGEAIALKWCDIDFQGRFLEIKRSIVRGRSTSPKSNKGRRVDMSQQLTQTLKEHRIKAKEKGIRLGLGKYPEYVFTNRVGKPLDKDHFRRRIFYKALEKAEMRRVRIHDLRHTYATLRISKGDNIADVSNQLGHYSVKLTLDTYYHWMPGKNKHEVDSLDTLHQSAPYPHPEASETKKGVADFG